MTEQSALLGLPAAKPYELVSSWVTRAALSQGVSPLELRKFLDWAGRGDLDLAFAKRTLPIKAWLLPVIHHLSFGQHIMANFLDSGLDPKLHIVGQGSGYRFTFCPMCVGRLLDFAVPVHWRFSGWMYCPTHLCYMERHCTKCGSTPSASANLLAAQWPSLAVCGTCDQPLRECPPRPVSEALEIDNVQAMKLKNGRALLAALWHGKVQLGPDEAYKPLRQIKKVDGYGLLQREQG